MKVRKEPKKINGDVDFDERKNELDAEKEAEKRKKHSKFSDFTQWNNKVYKLEEQIMKKSATAYRVFKFLVHHMDKYNGVVVSYETIGDFLEISKTSVYRAIKLLKDNKFIDVYKTGNANVYAVNHNIVWKNFGNRMKYSKFGANVILSFDQQEENMKKRIKEYRHKEIKLEKE